MGFQPMQDPWVSIGLFAQVRDCGGQQFVGHGSRLRGASQRFQSGLEVKVQYLAPSDGYDARSSPGLDPAQRRVHEQARDRDRAMFRNDRQQSYFVNTVIERKGKYIA